MEKVADQDANQEINVSARLTVKERPGVTCSNSDEPDLKNKCCAQQN